MRIGNGAFDQRQNDVFGAVLDSILLHTRRSERLPRRLWPIVEAQAECATKVWREPDQGIWEARGEPQHYVSSKLMCWVALDRAAQARRDPRRSASWQATWRATAEEIRADILEHGVTERGVLRQHYETDALDASTLLAAIFGFLPADDERLRATVDAIADELTENGFVLRYRTDETDDGLSGKEGTFLICSFWLVSALAIVGELQRARDLMEKLLRIASPLGLYAEEFDADTGRHLGNFPQAFSHLALIEAAARIIVVRAAREEAEALRRTMDAYDVIIIGTGAGGGTLARHLAPSGKRILLLERGDWLPREPQNWRAQDVFVDNRYVSPDTWYDENGKAFQPQVHYFVGGATKLYGAALYRLRAEDFGELRHHDGISPAWPISYDELEPYYTQAEQLYEVHGAPRRGPDRAAGERAVSVPGGLARAADPAARRRPRGRRLPPVPRAVRDPARRGEPALQRAASAARPATASRASCTRSRTPRCSASGRRSSTPNVTLLTNAKAVEARDERGGHGRDRGRRRARRRDRALRGRHRRRRVRRREHGEAAARLGERQASERPRERLRPGRPQLHVPRRASAVLALSREENPTVFQKTLGLNDFYFGSDEHRLPARQHPDGRQVAGADVPRREARRDEARAAMVARADRAARDRLLALDRGPADAREPGHRRRRRPAHARVHARRTTMPKQRALREAEVDARQARHGPRPPVRTASPT